MAVKIKILIVEDQFIEANNIRLLLKEAGYTVLPLAASVTQALEVLRQESADLVLLDILLEGEQSGIDLAKILKSRGTPFIYLSANSDQNTLDSAKETEPYGFLVKPLRKKDVLIMLDVALYLHKQRTDIGESPTAAVATPDNYVIPIIGESRGIKEVLNNIRIVAPSELSVLILGENGTGKELVAEGIHRLSGRKDKPLITVNCAVLPAELIESELFGHEKGAFTGAHEKRSGKFEQAEGGTIFLDEIGELPPNLQAKFLRVLQSREIEPIGGKSRKVNVRIIAATNRNLEEEVTAGRFRMDLYYRLNVFCVKIPPLRQRREDIPLLAAHFLTQYCLQQKKQISRFAEPVLHSMINHYWPGNIRELENFVARSVLITTGPIILTSDLPVTAGNNPSKGAQYQVKSMAQQEKDHIISVLTRCNWKLHGKGGAAELLEINASTLRSRMKKLGIAKKQLTSQ
ncbi:MAG TPA: sigma-54 dependent transcriptional regulator [Puia sp.]|jgi:DNA-binding NtrC family response regulator|nr:sigma-54 dependent transcriptional regulator [Puia sp.]